MYRPVRKTDGHGRPYTLWEVPDLRRIHDKILKSVVFVYPTEDVAVEGKGYGGSGFLVVVTAADDLTEVSSNPLEDPAHVYVVTNAHVAADCSFVRTSHPSRPIIHVESWTNHPEGDDLAIAYLGILGVTPIGVHKIVHHGVLISPQSFATNQIGPGDQCFMTGRFTGMDERERTAATVRAGILSIAETVKVEDKKWGGVLQESFFVEINSKAGYSGSAVYVDIPLEIPPVKPVIMYPPRPQFQGLLGITWGLWEARVPLLDPDTGKRIPERWVIQENTGIELVIPAWRITQLLMEENVVKHRNEFADDARKNVRDLKPDAVATNAQPLPDEPPQLTKADFEEALRKVSRRKPSPPDEGTSGT